MSAAWKDEPIDWKVCLEGLHRVNSLAAARTAILSHLSRADAEFWEEAHRRLRHDAMRFVTRHPLLVPRSISTIYSSYGAGAFLYMLEPEANRLDFFQKIHGVLLGISLGITYTDDFLDSTGVSRRRKVRYAKYLMAKMQDHGHRCANRDCESAEATFDMMLSAGVSQGTLEALKAILLTHHASALSPPRADDGFLELCLRQGRECGHLLAEAARSSHRPLLGRVGQWFQLLDDAADVHDDIANGIRTFATATYTRTGYLDAYWSVIDEHTSAILGEIDAQDPRRFSESLGALRRGIVCMTSLSRAKMAPDLKAAVGADVRVFYACYREKYEDYVRALMGVVRCYTHLTAVLAAVLQALLGCAAPRRSSLTSS